MPGKIIKNQHAIIFIAAYSKCADQYAGLSSWNIINIKHVINENGVFLAKHHYSR
jgi:hypothetical protein